VLFLAGITNINPDLYEAAENRWSQCTPKVYENHHSAATTVIIFVVLTTIIGCFQIFEEPFMIFAGGGGGGGQVPIIGGPENSCLTGVWLLYDVAFGTIMKFGYGSAIAYTMFVFIALVSVGLYRIMQRRES